MNTNDESLTKVFHPNKQECFEALGYEMLNNILYLNEQEWDKFMETMNNPPEPSPYLIEALKRYKDRRDWK